MTHSVSSRFRESVRLQEEEDQERPGLFQAPAAENSLATSPGPGPKFPPIGASTASNRQLGSAPLLGRCSPSHLRIKQASPALPGQCPPGTGRCRPLASGHRPSALLGPSAAEVR